MDQKPEIASAATPSELYRYQPSIPLAIVVTVCFATTTFLHAMQVWKHRTYYFIPLTFGAFLEMMDSIGQGIAHSNRYDIGIFTMQTITLLLTPALFAASIYMTWAKLVLFANGESKSPISKLYFTKFFILCEVASFAMQTLGVGYLSHTSDSSAGKVMIKIGLIIQMFTFTLFFLVALIFDYRIYVHRTPVSLIPHTRTHPNTARHWQTYLFALYLASILIKMRSIFRVMNFVGWVQGHLLRYEVGVYVFDEFVLFVGLVALNALHPGALVGWYSSRRRGEDDLMRLRDLEEPGFGESRAGTDERK